MASCLLVPTLAYDLSLLDRLVNSIDYKIDEKVIVNNGKWEAISEWSDSHPDWLIIQQNYNIGCAASWNIAPDVFPNDNYWLISNDDQVFQPGMLETIFNTGKIHADNYDMIHINEHEAYDIFMWTRRGFNFFGKFDENFYPVYFEDYEMRLRMRAGDAKIFHISGIDKVHHGKPQPHGETYTAICKQCGELNKKYLIEKWGSEDCEKPVYKFPFNDQAKAISQWELNINDRAARYKIIESLKGAASWDAYK